MVKIKTKKLKIILILSCILVVGVVLSIVLFHSFNDKPNYQEQFIAYYNDKVKMFEEENKTLGDIDVVFIGDSLTDGYDLKKYYPQYKTANRGISGDTTFGVEKRLNNSLFDINAKVAVMLIGANNIDRMFENYEQILIQMKENAPSTKIVLLSLTAMGGTWAEKNQMAILNNQRIKSLAKKYNFTFIDLFTALCNVETGEIFAEYTVDGGHFTDKGYEVVTAEITPVLKDLLKK